MKLMKKILFTFTLYLISGPVSCVDVIGYSGGSVIIISNLEVGSGKSKYLCKVENRKCTDINSMKTGKNRIQEEKFILYENSQGFLTVFIRKLKPQDAGTYTMGVGISKKTDVNLKVLNDSCCVGPKITNAFRRQNITFTCNYPAEYKEYYKYIEKIENDRVVEVILNTGSQPQNGRFFISDDRRAKVLSVNISDVSEDDDGFYLCGVHKRVFPIGYFSYFLEVQLQVTASTFMMTSAAPTEISSHVGHSSWYQDTVAHDVHLLQHDLITPAQRILKRSGNHHVVISMCVCVALLLIGGCALMIYKWRHKKILGSTPSSKCNEQAPTIYENDWDKSPPYENLNMEMRSNHQTPNSSTSQTNSTYQTLDPLTNQSDSGYESLTNTSIQSHSHYQCLTPATQMHSVYHTLHS